MAGTVSKSGLQCSHGSELDVKIPRPKMPSTALPPELRKKLGLPPRKQEVNTDSTIWTPGSGVLAKVGSGRDGTFLKRRSGVPMSERASALAQKNFQPGSIRANVSKARLSIGGNDIPLEMGTIRRSRRSEVDEYQERRRKSPRTSLESNANDFRKQFEDITNRHNGY